MFSRSFKTFSSRMANFRHGIYVHYFSKRFGHAMCKVENRCSCVKVLVLGRRGVQVVSNDNIQFALFNNTIQCYHKVDEAKLSVSSSWECQADK